MKTLLVMQSIYMNVGAKSTKNILTHLLHQQCLMKMKLCILFFKTLY